MLELAPDIEAETAVVLWLEDASFSDVDSLRELRWPEELASLSELELSRELR